MLLTLIDYQAGNLNNVKNACQHIISNHQDLRERNLQLTIARTPKEIEAASILIFPGVGAASPAMNALREQQLTEVIPQKIHQGTPFLGVCVGFQILFEFSEEENTDCLGVIPGQVKRFPDKEVKVPHIGWNSVKQNDRKSTLWNGIPDQSRFYYVHSYYPAPEKTENVVGHTDYGLPFCGALQKDNLVGSQFHPERSGSTGLQFLTNFLHFAVAKAEG